MVRIEHNPRNWFWLVGGDESRFWSSAVGAYVTELPAGWYASPQAASDVLGPDWLNEVTGIPTRIAGEEELAGVLASYGLPGPVAIVPASVTPYQARIALLNVNLLAPVEALMADPETDQAAKIAWEYATTIERHSAFIAALEPALGLTEEQVDALFIAAAAVS